MAWISSHAAHEKVAAIGEIGLDYHWPEPEPALQKQWFRRQIELAKEVKLPIIVHSRDAAEPTMQIIQETKAYECGGVIHCYSYSPEMAEEYVKMGFFIGMGGVLTFKNAKKLVTCAERIPLSSIVLETDCPYMAPEPYRGKRNQSSYIRYVAEKIAELKEMSQEEVIAVTEKNARDLYGI
jgi:TatD DNase family protein